MPSRSIRRRKTPFTRSSLRKIGNPRYECIRIFVDRMPSSQYFHTFTRFEPKRFSKLLFRSRTSMQEAFVALAPLGYEC